MRARACSAAGVFHFAHSLAHRRVIAVADDLVEYASRHRGAG